MPYHTDLREVFRALDDCETRFRWLLSGMSAMGNPTQLVWGSLSGFPPGHQLNESEELANAPSPLQFRGAIQHPAAEIEIVAFDSSFAAIVARDCELEHAFRTHFGEAHDWLEDA